MAAHLMTGLAESHNLAGVSLYPAMHTSIEHGLTNAGIPLWHLGKRPGFDHRMFLALDRLIREIRPHIVHTHMSVLRYALPGLLWRQAPVVIHTLHNVAEHETDRLGRFLRWLAFGGRVIPVAISREVASSATRVYGLECPAVIPNGIPVDEYQASPAERTRWRAQEGFEPNAILFTFVGRLEPQKNPLLLVEALARLNDSRAHLVLAGEGRFRDAILAEARQRGIAQRVHLLGKRNAVRECLGASDVFVLASDWEGNPLAVMEAMAAGLPVIGTAVGGVPELVKSGEHGILVNRGDGLALANSMRILLNDPEKRKAMAHAAHARARERFDARLMVQSYAALYRAAVAGVVDSVIHCPLNPVNAIKT
jgi:glycosyltransferase involved in cell wall biosynthesis